MKNGVALISGMALWAIAGTVGVGQAQLAAPAPPVVDAPAPTPAPKIRFLEPTYDFGKISSGEVVKHEFTFKNEGGQVLEITDVRPSCGCTTAGTWTRRAGPGQSGVIPIQFSSLNFNGPVSKPVTVTCNDTSQPTVMLTIKGTIWRPIEVTPTYAVFNLVEGAQTNEVRSVRIVNNLETPMEVSKPECTNSAFQAELETVQPGKEFKVNIKAVAPAGAKTVSTPITLKTSSTNMPVITINAFATVQPAVMVYPSQLNLPPGPLNAATPYNVMVRNNATAAISVSEPSVNAEGVDAKVQETQPGRFFTVTLKFPTGFQINSNRTTELSFKTSHPQFGLVKVPILQMARPAPGVYGPQFPPRPPGALGSTPMAPGVRPIPPPTAARPGVPVPPVPPPPAPAPPAATK